MSAIDSQLEALPEALRGGVARAWTAFEAAAAAAQLAAPADGALPAQLCRVWAGSDFVVQQCLRQPRLLTELLTSGDLQRRYDPQAMAARVAASLQAVSDAETLGAGLRRLRNREMVRIAWRDLAGLADLDETMTDLSALAAACIEAALARLQEWLAEELGEPCNGAGEPQRLVVLGMGKLGAGELNFSSDVDLIFAYAEGGETRGGRRDAVSNEQFFTRLGKGLIKALDENTAEGFVFRVDMRLRPFGTSGALAASFDAMEQYYQVHGRDWERYALIKAAVVAGDRAAGERLLAMLRPFVYRRYLDYGAFEALRDMKRMVEAEVKRKGMANHVKLGAGGIREVEFIGQAFQLIRGGRDPALQQRGIQPVLAYLAEQDYLPRYVQEQLQAAYVFLRNTEHRLQEYQDKQTHYLPEDELNRLRLAYAMGYSHWDEFLPVLRGHMARVHSHFEQVFAAPQTEHAGTEGADLGEAWAGSLAEEEALAVLTAAGYGDAAAVLTQLRALRDSRSYRALSTHGQLRMDRLMPLLLGAVAGGEAPDATLARLLALVTAIARRTAYLALLVEHPMALSQLVRLCGASPWIAKLLARHPLLLDELLDPRSLYRPPNKEQLAAELRRRLARVPAGDEEQAMDVLRQFKQASMLRVAAADVMEAVPLMVVSDHLTAIAEVILEAVLALAWDHLVARHGRPACARAADATAFAIIAYGKLGGIELGYGSDLDMVFVHGAEDAGTLTDGAKAVADQVFYARLGQRIIHILTAHTPAGVLYEVDMRLRPSGNSGLLVVSLGALRDYQFNQAWTWEHQALARARPVAGDAHICAGFAQLRREVLGLQRDPLKLKREVVEMRERMRQALAKEEAGRFDLKQGRGGIADIEFMVQYHVLSRAHEMPELTEFTDNIRQLESCARHGLLRPADAGILSDAYRAYRAEVHRLTLQEQPAVTDAEAFAAVRHEVMRLWRATFGENNEENAV
jgi:glutamate-ammonia-ligase adenylyltransferase